MKGPKTNHIDSDSDSDSDFDDISYKLPYPKNILINKNEISCISLKMKQKTFVKNVVSWEKENRDNWIIYLEKNKITDPVEQHLEYQKYWISRRIKESGKKKN